MKKKGFFYIIFLIQYFFAIDSDSLSAEWFTSAGDYNSIKFSKIETINTDNANNLELAWTFKNGFVPDKNSTFRNNNQATPIFTGKYLISSSMDGFVIAMNPQNGKEIWRTKIDNPAARRGFTYFGENIFIPSGKGHIIHTTCTSFLVWFGTMLFYKLSRRQNLMSSFPDACVIILADI